MSNNKRTKTELLKMTVFGQQDEVDTQFSLYNLVWFKFSFLTRKYIASIVKKKNPFKMAIIKS